MHIDGQERGVEEASDSWFACTGCGGPVHIHASGLMPFLGEYRDQHGHAWCVAAADGDVEITRKGAVSADQHSQAAAPMPQLPGGLRAAGATGLALYDGPGVQQGIVLHRSTDSDGAGEVSDAGEGCEEGQLRAVWTGSGLQWPDGSFWELTAVDVDDGAW